MPNTMERIEKVPADNFKVPSHAACPTPTAKAHKASVNADMLQKDRWRNSRNAAPATAVRNESPPMMRINMTGTVKPFSLSFIHSLLLL